MAAAPKELAAYAAITRKCSLRKLSRAAEGKRKTLFAIIPGSSATEKLRIRSGDFRLARHPPNKENPQQRAALDV